MNIFNKKWLYITFFITVSAIFILSCNSKMKEATSTYNEDMAVEMSISESPQMLAGAAAKRMSRPDADTQTAVERKLIKTGYINFESEDIKSSRILINNLVSKYGAYINNENENSTTKMLEQYLVIKIPKNNFDAFVESLESGITKISSKNIDIEDVTEEFIDITARLTVKKEAEQTYLRLLATAKTVRDVLDIQDQIQGIRSDIESIEGRIRYLESAVSYCTLNIRMYQYIASNESLPRTSFFTRLLSSIKSGVNTFAEVIIGIVHAWVFILIGIILAIVLKLYCSKKRRGKNEHK